MERRFRIFLIAVLVLAAAAMAALGIFTFGRLHDSESRMAREDRAVFDSLTQRLQDPENITGVRIQVDSTMGDYDRYNGFDKTMLAGLEFLHHEYLYGGTGSPGEDMTITVTLYKPKLPPLVEKILFVWDETFGTDYAARTENILIHRDEDVFRITCGESNFTAACPGMTEWLDGRGSN